MMQRISTLIAVAVLGILPGAAQAEETVLRDGFRDCIAGVADSRGIPGCIAAAQGKCTAIAPGTPELASCFTAARAEWGAAMVDILQSFGDRPQNFQDIARIEAKYSLLQHLLTCDRQAELSAIGRTATAKDEEAKLVCQATASAAAYTEVLIRSGTITLQ